MLKRLHRAQIFWNFAYSYFNSTVEWFGDVMPLDDCFIMQQIYCLHRAQVRINMNKKIEQRL